MPDTSTDADPVTRIDLLGSITDSGGDPVHELVVHHDSRSVWYRAYAPDHEGRRHMTLFGLRTASGEWYDISTPQLRAIAMALESTRRHAPVSLDLRGVIEIAPGVLGGQVTMHSDRRTITCEASPVPDDHILRDSSWAWSVLLPDSTRMLIESWADAVIAHEAGS